MAGHYVGSALISPLHLVYNVSFFAFGRKPLSSRGLCYCLMWNVSLAIRLDSVCQNSPMSALAICRPKGLENSFQSGIHTIFFVQCLFLFLLLHITGRVMHYRYNIYVASPSFLFTVHRIAAVKLRRRELLCVSFVQIPSGECRRSSVRRLKLDLQNERG